MVLRVTASGHRVIRSRLRGPAMIVYGTGPNPDMVYGYSIMTNTLNEWHWTSWDLPEPRVRTVRGL